MKAERRRQIAARRERLRREHRCIHCGREAVNRNYCETHRQWHNRYNRERYRVDPAARERKHQTDRARRFATHPRTCLWCGRPLTPEERAGAPIHYHAACREVARRAWSREAYQRTNATAWYRAAHLRAVRRYQDRMRQAGRCRGCGRPNPAATTVCPACVARQRAARSQGAKPSRATARSREPAASRSPIRPQRGKRPGPG